MLSKMTRKLIIGLCLTLAILCGSIITKAVGINIKPFQLNPSSIISVQKSVSDSKTVMTFSKDIVQSKGRILIYSTHTCEKNVDSSISDVASDLANKLRNKGYIVDHDTTDFTGTNEYPKAYSNSREMLLTKNLSSYDICLDIHMDGTESAIVTEINDKDVAKVMFPTTSKNPYLIQETNIINGIKEGMSRFSNSIVRGQTTNYMTGINHYNLSMSPNMLLVEIGSNKNTIMQCKLSNTYLASSIDLYLTTIK